MVKNDHKNVKWRA